MVLIGDPALHAALYPETVRRACILASPHWVGAAVSADQGDQGDQNRFYAEVARRLDLSKYRPCAIGDPPRPLGRSGGPAGLCRSVTRLPVQRLGQLRMAF